MGMMQLTEEEIQQLKIKSGCKIHEDCLFLIVEAPSNRQYSFDVHKKDKRYLCGVIFTYPKSVQKEMWKYVIKNFILPQERRRWIEEIKDWLEQLKLDENILGVS